MLHLAKEFKLYASLMRIFNVLLLDPFFLELVLCNPCTKMDSSLIERIQRRFLSSSAFILKINQSYYNFGLVSLANRRVEANLLFVHILIHGYIDAHTLLAQVRFKVPSRQTRSYAPLAITSHNTNYRKTNLLIG